MLALPHEFKVWQSLEQVNAAAQTLGQEWLGQTALEGMLLQAKSKWLSGYCVGCQAVRRFDYRQIAVHEPNWRESLRCEKCDLINRWRAALHLFQCLQRPAGSVYLTEQTSRLFRHIKKVEPRAIGSEFSSSATPPGQPFRWRLRRLQHEDVTRLSFTDASQAAVLSFDVLEHVADFHAAVHEFARVLQPGGLLLLSVPFNIQQAHTTVRARQTATGEIEHLLPAQFHGDPLNGKGVLCFQDFGWDLLDDFRTAGLDQVQLITACSPAFGYLGAAQPFLIGWR